MTPDDTPRSNRRHPALKVLAVIAALIALLVLIWDWNWFKGLVERKASATLGRKVSLQHFDVNLSWHPLLMADGITIANPESYDEGGDMAKADRVAVRVDLKRLMHSQTRVDELIIARPIVELRRSAAGNVNWNFPLSEKQQDKAVTGPEIAALTITDGSVHLLDPKALKADVMLKVHTEPAAGADEPKLIASIEGKYNNQPIEGRFIGGAALTLRDLKHPYPVDFKLANGNTKVTAIGSMLEPMRMGNADITLDLSGDDLADLYPLTTVPLPRTAKYHLHGALDYASGSFRFTRFTGNVGESDLEGDVSLTPARDRRREVNAKLTSKKVVMADLAGFVGGTPGQSEAPSQSPAQRAEHARNAASGKLLPDKPISLPKLRSADVHVHFIGDRIEGNKMPLDNMVAQLDIVDGRIGLKPLSFKTGSGQIVINLALDAQKDVINAAGDIDFRHIDLAHFMEKMTIFKGGGTVAGKARIEASGNSLASMLGSGDGEVQLFTSGGDLSSVLVDLTGLNFGSALLSALGLPSRADLRCAIADYELKKGVLGTRMLLIDTTEANIIGEGTINLHQEEVDYKVRTEPKRPSVLSFKGPVDITGELRNPKIRPDAASVAKRAGAAAVLGLLLTPLAALLPTIQLGLGDDNDCVKLVAEARAQAGQTASEGKAEVQKRNAPPPRKPQIPPKEAAPAPAPVK